MFNTQIVWGWGTVLRLYKISWNSVKFSESTDNEKMIVRQQSWYFYFFYFLWIPFYLQAVQIL
jgi:hypothetical protein